MNNFYTLIYLNREIKEKIRGGYFSYAISPHKDVLHIYIEREEETARLIFSANPAETVLFLDRYRPPKKRNVTNFFTPLERQKITGMSLAEKDRLVSVYFEDGSHLLFKLFSGRPNVFWVQTDVITDTFKHPEQLKGSEPPRPTAPEFKEQVSPGRSAKNQMTEINPLLPRNLLPYLVEQHNVDQMSPEEVKLFTHRATQALETDPHPRVLATGDFCLWSKEWLDMSEEKSCKEVNDCVAFAYKNAVHLRRLHNKKEDVIQFLERIEGQKEGTIHQLQQAEKSLERADQYEKYGHLLMAHAHERLAEGTQEMTLSDFYENDRPITIPLKEGLDISGNAEYYYDKAKDARKSFQKARERLPAEQEKLDRVRQLLKEVRQLRHLPDLNSWLKDNSETLGRFGFGDSDDKQASSPYRKFKVGKYEVWVGKSAKSNDALTSLAHKEDIWLHARGVGGSHTVIRMGNQKEYPPKEIILRAAGYAAYYSKARGMKTAPVMYTKRKYVRKPKGASPGAVVVEREEVEMVPPVNPHEIKNSSL